MTEAKHSSNIQTFRVLVVPGDGIGREVIPAAQEVLSTTGLPIEFHAADAGWECFQRQGNSLPDTTLAAARLADAILFGAVSSPSQPVAGYRSPIVGLRRALNLYANIRPVVSLNPLGEQAAVTPRRVDLVVVRENTEGLYAGKETSDGETAIAQRVITRAASERIVRAAFELARRRAATTGHQSHVTIVHKANVLRETCGLFRTTAFTVAADYPDVAADEQLVDSAALLLVQRPERFDVLVTTNMFGDILSDVASYWGGGLGMATSANIGDQQALFEPVHGSAPDIAGKGLANPLAAIGCAAMLLDYLGQQATARGLANAQDYSTWAARVRAAIQSTLAGSTRTPDLGGQASTVDVVQTVLSTLA